MSSLCSATAPVTIFLFRDVYPESNTDDSTVLILPTVLLATTLSVGSTLLLTAHTIPCITPVLERQGFFFGFLTFEDGIGMLCRNVGNELPILAV
jgi:hypothetical protein